MTGGSRDRRACRRACPRNRRKGPTARGADRRAATTAAKVRAQRSKQQGAQQPAGTKNLRDTNVEPREENPKASQESLINIFCGAPAPAMSTLSFPEATGDETRLD